MRDGVNVFVLYVCVASGMGIWEAPPNSGSWTTVPNGFKLKIIGLPGLTKLGYCWPKQVASEPAEYPHPNLIIC